MIIFVDSNVLVSAILNPNSIPYKAFIKAVTLPNKAFICQQNVDEVIKTFRIKFPSRLNDIETFFETASSVLEIVPVPKENTSTENTIRDLNDRPILRAAMKVDADIILTGDKDFLEAGLTKPLPMTPAQFLLHTAYEIVNDNNYFVHDPIEKFNITRK